MPTFIAIEYEDPHKAHEVRLALVRLQREYLIDLEDAVVAVKDPQGKVKMHQSFNLTATGAFSGGFWGSLIGLLFLSPLLGAVIGASARAVAVWLRRGCARRIVSHVAGTIAGISGSVRGVPSMQLEADAATSTTKQYSPSARL